MFAVIKTGGKQYKVQAGDVLRVEKLDASAGDTVQLNDVLMIGGDDVTVGDPLVEGAAVTAEVVEQIKGEKVIHFVKRRRKHSSQRKKGHRQNLTLLRVTEVVPAGGVPATSKAEVADPAVEVQPEVEAATAVESAADTTAEPAVEAQAEPQVEAQTDAEATPQDGSDDAPATSKPE
ncbi:MAG: 50S ribosomal protein L21 [Pseudomonadota bacterium]